MELIYQIMLNSKAYQFILVIVALLIILHLKTQRVFDKDSQAANKTPEYH